MRSRGPPAVTGTAGQVFGRTLVVAERGANVTIIDRYRSADLTGTVVEDLVVAGGTYAGAKAIVWAIEVLSLIHI